MRYKHTEISNTKANTIRRKDRSWIDFCENNHGSCYWNERTGEIMWYDDDENKVRYQELVND